MARKEQEVFERCEALKRQAQHDPWHGEALGALLWALRLAHMPPYDTPFAPRTLAADPEDGDLRHTSEIDEERQVARLWHWRARTADLVAAGTPSPPGPFASLDQAVAAAAVEGYERGLLDPPLRGDFRAYDTSYRQLSPEDQAEAHVIAAERHHALAWLCGDATWDDTPLDT